jgi:hypothetical protein
MRRRNLIWFKIRMTRGLRRDIHRAAKRRGLTVNDFAIAVLKRNAKR